MGDLNTKELLSLKNSIIGYAFEELEYPFMILDNLKDIIKKTGSKLDKLKFEEVRENVWVAKSARIYENVHIDPPVIIDEGAEIRCGAFIRGSAVVGKNAVLGNSCELKNSVLFDNVQVPHYNYVGDSVLGYKSHMAAGSITSNIKSDKSPVVIKSGNERVETGRKKVGAVLGDNVEIGCNSVLNPGTVIGKNTNVYPLSSVRGYVKADSIYKNADEIVNKYNMEPQ